MRDAEKLAKDTKSCIDSSLGIFYCHADMSTNFIQRLQINLLGVQQ